MDKYQSIAGPSEGFLRDRGSKFLAYAFPVDTEKDIHEGLDKVRQLHPKARHHCYAYRLGTDGNNFRANDDGEPSGTAGKPILGRIDSFELTNVLVVVVRYFGGTLLGASGLIRAYKQSTADALEQAKIIERTVEDIYSLAFDYSQMSTVMNAISRFELEMVEKRFGDTAEVDVAIRKSDVNSILRQIKASVADVYLEV
ncbi:MAG: YigZ family protein [Pseudomonadota bacterium]